MTPTIIILALVAAFLGLRLYSVLGKHGDDGVLPRTDEKARTAPNAPPVALPDLDTPLQPSRGQPLAYTATADMGLRAIMASDRSFDVARFLGGAQAAYRMILEAFWRGDKDALRELCDADSFDAFADAIDARAATGQTLDNRLLAIDRALITDASLSGGFARITVSFDADIAAVTRDADGNVIAGSMTDAMESHDSWSFVRAVSSKDPNWLLDETDAA